MKPTDIKSSEILSWAQEKVKKQHLPIPKKPEQELEEYELPDNFADMNSIELSQWASWFNAWYSRTVWLLGLCESELLLVENEYRLKINSKGGIIREKRGRVSEAVIESLVLADDGEMGEIYQRRLELLSLRPQLDALIKVYERSTYALSRELSRREYEARIVGTGG
ncbi:MAG TPA: hypothetical protein ENI23_04135 [bacterium]|nr:hypothetical protein [bacterium]